MSTSFTPQVGESSETKPNGAGFAPDEPLSATLPAQDWNIVLAGLDELPGKFGRRVIDKLSQQLMQR